MTEPKRIAILTGGGDVPGLNAVIKSVVYRATEAGYTALGIRRGWEGLTHLRHGDQAAMDYLRPLDRINTRTIERTGGTVRVVESTPANFKVTTPHDLQLAAYLLADRLPRPSAY